MSLFDIPSLFNECIQEILSQSWNICLFKENTNLNNSKYA